MHPSTCSFRSAGLASALLSLAAVATLAGCATSEPRYATRGSATVVVSDDYIYYPDSEVYYSNTRHSYVYRNGSRWVTQSAPPRTWVNTAPSVHIDFHDAPERHHADVVRTYPKNWRSGPAAKAPDQRNDQHPSKDKDKDDHRDQHDAHRKNQ